ncbi:MAG: D-alanyl-D-alanine carboxypeptidase family protein [Verrucomicrobiota bacterium]|nr:D-alanyl-D-alanine carboxypeptidase family protein [Verrucomicrobiota bacterium]
MKILSLPLVLFIFITAHAVAAPRSQAPQFTREEVQNSISANAVLLVNARSNQVLFQKNPTKQLMPASTTKLMTALLVMENPGLKGQVLVKASDTQVEPNVLPLVTGESISVRELMHAMLIGSENDAAKALARHVGGSESQFIEMMNARAKQLGCTSTRYANPHGLTHPGQYTTCVDLLKIFRKAISYREIKSILETERYTAHSARGPKLIRNRNLLLGVMPEMRAAKTGYTDAAGHTFAASAVFKGTEMHLILLKSKNKWKDSRVLFNYGFHSQVDEE